MSAILISALFLHRKGAHDALESLLLADFPAETLTAVMSDATRAQPFGPDEVVNKAHDTATAATIGGIVGTVLASVVTVGAFAALGPLAALFAGVSGGITGSLAGALVGAGLPEQHAQGLTDRIERGGILLGVYTGEGRRSEARRLLEKAGGEFIENN